MSLLMDIMNSRNSSLLLEIQKRAKVPLLLGKWKCAQERQNCDDFKKCPSSMDHLCLIILICLRTSWTLQKRLRTHRSTRNFVFMKNYSIFYDYKKKRKRAKEEPSSGIPKDLWKWAQEDKIIKFFPMLIAHWVLSNADECNFNRRLGGLCSLRNTGQFVLRQFILGQFILRKFILGQFTLKDSLSWDSLFSKTVYPQNHSFLPL